MARIDQRLKALERDFEDMPALSRNKIAFLEAWALSADPDLVALLKHALKVTNEPRRPTPREITAAIGFNEPLLLLLMQWAARRVKPGIDYDPDRVEHDDHFHLDRLPTDDPAHGSMVRFKCDALNDLQHDPAIIEFAKTFEFVRRDNGERD